MNPWDDHVRPFGELPSDALKEAVAFDQHLRALAETDQSAAAGECVGGRIHYRSGAPRLGEPVFRDERAAELGHETTGCGRGTGHLGSGLYFFGTLSAAWPSGRPEPPLSERTEAQLRDGGHGVWVVDVSSLSPPEETSDHEEWRRALGWVMRPRDKKATWKLHDFGMALACYPDAFAKYQGAEAELAEVEAKSAQARSAADAWDGPFSGHEWERLSDEDWELQQQVKDLREQRRRTKGSALSYAMAIEFNGPRYEVGDREPAEVGPLAPRPQAAIDAYLRDTEERRFPGYHPMTYYMRSIGALAVIHYSWGELNSGDIGNIWYPEVPE